MQMSIKHSRQSVKFFVDCTVIYVYTLNVCVCTYVGISAVLLLVIELVNKLMVQNSRYVYTHMHVLSMYIAI